MTVVLLRDGKQQNLVIPQMSSLTFGFYAAGKVREHEGQAQDDENGAWRGAFSGMERDVVHQRCYRPIHRKNCTRRRLYGRRRWACANRRRHIDGMATRVGIPRPTRRPLYRLTSASLICCPLPPLDGGQIFMYLAEKVSRRNN